MFLGILDPWNSGLLIYVSLCLKKKTLTSGGHSGI